jgi:ketosteroid isomerase-like protein
MALYAGEAHYIPASGDVEEDVVRNVAVMLAALLTCCSPHRAPGGDAVAQIRNVMDGQVEAWNAGDLDGYMQGYWRSDSLTFHGGSRLIRGWDSLSAMYASAYPGERRGRLAFTDVAVSLICDDAAWVRGRWNVEFPDTMRSGRFTLIFKRTGDGWRIVHDHSS